MRVRYLTWPDSAVQGVDSVSLLVAVTTVVTRIISCYYWWCLISLINTGEKIQAYNNNGLCSSTERNLHIEIIYFKKIIILLFFYALIRQLTIGRWQMKERERER